jgi:hypothetical protein
VNYQKIKKRVKKYLKLKEWSWGNFYLQELLMQRPIILNVRNDTDISIYEESDISDPETDVSVITETFFFTETLNNSTDVLEEEQLMEYEEFVEIEED